MNPLNFRRGSYNEPVKKRGNPKRESIMEVQHQNPRLAGVLKPASRGSNSPGGYRRSNETSQTKKQDSHRSNRIEKRSHEDSPYTLLPGAEKDVKISNTVKEIVIPNHVNINEEDYNKLLKLQKKLYRKEQDPGDFGARARTVPLRLSDDQRSDINSIDLKLERQRVSKSYRVAGIKEELNEDTIPTTRQQTVGTPVRKIPTILELADGHIDYKGKIKTKMSIPSCKYIPRSSNALELYDRVRMDKQDESRRDFEKTRNSEN
jgi:hypothetical protein